MASDEFSSWTLPGGDSSEELGGYVNGAICNLPVRDLMVDDKAATNAFQTKQPML